MKHILCRILDGHDWKQAQEWIHWNGAWKTIGYVCCRCGKRRIQVSPILDIEVMEKATEWQAQQSGKWNLNQNSANVQIQVGGNNNVQIMR